MYQTHKRIEYSIMMFQIFKLIFDTSFRLSRPFFETELCNGKRDFGLKFTIPEFCLPFSPTVNRRQVTASPWTTLMDYPKMNYATEVYWY